MKKILRNSVINIAVKSIVKLYIVHLTVLRYKRISLAFIMSIYSHSRYDIIRDAEIFLQKCHIRLCRGISSLSENLVKWFKFSLKKHVITMEALCLRKYILYMGYILIANFCSNIDNYGFLVHTLWLHT